jgi:hypothetical protein
MPGGPSRDTIRWDRSPGALRGAAGEHDDVTGFQRRAHRQFERDVFVGERAERHRLTAGFDDRGGDDGAVAVIDAGGRQRPAGLDQFVAGREHGDARAPHHVDGSEPARREHADFARADARAAAQQRFAARDIGAGIGNELAARRGAAQRDGRRDLGFDQFGMLDHHHRIGTARDDAAGRDRGRGAGQHFDGRRNAAGDHFGIERETFWRAVAGTRGVGGAHRKAVDIGAVKRRCIDRRDHVGREHARQRRAQRQAFTAKRRAIDAGIEAAPRLVGGHHFEELLLPGGMLNGIEDRRTACAGFGGYGHDLTATGVPAAKPSLPAGTTIQPSLRASDSRDK